MNLSSFNPYNDCKQFLSFKDFGKKLFFKPVKTVMFL